MEAEDAFEELREATHVEEAGEIADIIASVSAEGAASASAAYPRLRQIVRLAIMLECTVVVLSVGTDGFLR